MKKKQQIKQLKVQLRDAKHVIADLEKLIFEAFHHSLMDSMQTPVFQQGLEKAVDRFVSGISQIPRVEKVDPIDLGQNTKTS